MVVKKRSGYFLNYEYYGLGKLTTVTSQMRDPIHCAWRCRSEHGVDPLENLDISTLKLRYRFARQSAFPKILIQELKASIIYYLCSFKQQVQDEGSATTVYPVMLFARHLVIICDYTTHNILQTLFLTSSKKFPFQLHRLGDVSAQGDGWRRQLLWSNVGSF